MKGTIAVLLACIAVLISTTCMTAEDRLPRGKYHSKDEPGVMVFRDDGVFGYKFAAKFDFRDEKNLPPMRARVILNSLGGVDVRDIEPNEPEFRIDWHPKDDAFEVIRIDPNGTLPRTARYEKKKG